MMEGGSESDREREEVRVIEKEEVRVIERVIDGGKRFKHLCFSKINCHFNVSVFKSTFILSGRSSSNEALDASYLQYTLVTYASHVC